MNGNHVINDPLAVIYNESCWRISSLSPMHNLQYDELKLRQYATHIRQCLALFSAVTSSSKFRVVIEESVDLRYSRDDPNALMITVSSSKENNTDKILYTAILLSWGARLSLNNAIHLPYMLERGELKIGSEVRKQLQNMFDCNIKQYNFTQLQLLLFGFYFVENDTSRSCDPFILIFKTPQANFNDRITLTFEVGDIHTIWNRIKDDQSTDSELIHVAYQILQKQLRTSITLDVTSFDLCEVLLSKSEVKNTGIVKMKTPEIVHAVFTVLNEILNNNYDFSEL